MGEPQLALDVEAAAEMGRRGSHSITEAELGLVARPVIAASARLASVDGRAF